MFKGGELSHMAEIRSDKECGLGDFSFSLTAVIRHSTLNCVVQVIRTVVKENE